LLNAPFSGGIYAFHLRLIRNARVGIGFGNDPQDIARAKAALAMLVRRVEDLELTGTFAGTLGEKESYDAHGRNIELTGVSPRTNYLGQQIADVDQEQIPSFVRTLEALSAFVPPLYVGIALKQTLQDRYKQHRRDYEAGPSDRTFGGRIAAAGLDWTDLSYSCVPQETLRLNDTSIKSLENYIQFICRPRMGRS